MWSEAEDYSVHAEEKLGYESDIPAYDRCDTYFTHDLAIDTQWSKILIMNSILYLCLSVFTLFMVLGYCFLPLLCSGCMCHCLGGIAQLICIIFTGVNRYSRASERCLENQEWELKDHGDKIGDLFIAQAVLYLFYNCCTCAILVVIGQIGRNKSARDTA